MVHALVDDGVQTGGIQGRDQLRAGRVLDAVRGPEGGGVGTGAGGVVDGGGGGKGRWRGGVVGGEGDVVWGVPVACGEAEGEGEVEEGVDGGCDITSVGDSEGAVLYGLLDERVNVTMRG